MTNFKVLKSSDVEEFEKNVNEYIDKGWLLINCSSVSSASDNEFIFHAFLKKTDFKRRSSFGGRPRDRDRDYRPRRNQREKGDYKDRKREKGDYKDHKREKIFSSEEKSFKTRTKDESGKKGSPRHEKRSDTNID